MSRHAGVLGAAFTLQHVPDLVRYGSKPSREPAQLERIAAALRSYDQALAYAPHQVFIGNLAPEELWRLPRPWWKSREKGTRTGPFGEILPQRDYYDLMAKVDAFGLLRLGQKPNEAAGEIALYEGREVVGSFARGHDVDESLSAPVLLENLASKASGVHALLHLLQSTRVDPESIDYALGCGEEAVGDRYQRGGGALAKAIAEAAGLVCAGGSDVKAFCAAPVHALIMAGSLVESGAYERVVLVAGGSLAKLGMKSAGALERGVPILEDVLAGMAILVGPAVDGAPTLRLDAVGRHRTGSGSAPQAVLKDIVERPLEKLGRRITDIGKYSTELHDPEITEPAGGGDVADRNYRMLGGMAVLKGEMKREAIGDFVREHGMPGFSPTQGHIASAVPWLPHALERFRRGSLKSTMLMAKGSLFLGRMTRLSDGASVVIDA